MMKQISVWITFLFITSFVACTPKLANTLPQGWSMLNNAKYSIQYPSTWKLDESGKLGTTFFINSPKKAAADFRENINLMVQDISSTPVSLEQFADLSSQGMESFLVDGKTLSNEEKSKGKQKYRRMVFEGGQGAYNLHFIQYYYLLDGNAYVLTLTTKADMSTAERQDMEKIMRTFTIK